MFYSIKSLLKGYTTNLMPCHMPNELIYFVTYRCNLRCRSCFYYSEIKKPKPELSLKELAKITTSLKKLSRLLISGGEPFLRDDLPEICGMFYRRTNVKNFFIPTNGMLPEKIPRAAEKMLKEYSNACFSLAVSLDGLKDTHDYLRGVKGSFDTALETLSRLSELKTYYPSLKVSIITVVSNKNYREIDKLAAFLRTELKINNLNLVPLRGYPQDADLKPPSAQQWQNLSETSIPGTNSYGKTGPVNRFRQRINLAQKYYLHKILAEALGGKKWPFQCMAGNMIGVLEPNGDVRLCELTPAVGNLKTSDYDFTKVWYSETARKQRKKMTGCTCTHGCFLIPSINYNLPYLLRSFIKL